MGGEGVQLQVESASSSNTISASSMPICTTNAPERDDVARSGDALTFRLNTDDVVVAGPDHPLIARGTADLPAIYLAVRHGTEARINRSTWLQLVDLADADLAVTSQGARFSLVPA